MLRTIITSVLLLFSFATILAASESWQGSLQVSISNDRVRPGETVNIQLDAQHRNRSRPQSVNGRDGAVWLVPQRFSLFDGASQQLSVTRLGERELQARLPAELNPGWHELIIILADDEGHVPSLSEALANTRSHGERTQRQIVAVPGDGRSPHILVHTERSRQVFSPGEEIRFMVSGRGRGGINAEVLLALYPQSQEQGRPMAIARGTLNAQGANSATLHFDYPASASAAIVPGDYYVVVIHDRQPVDRLPIRFVNSERPSGGSRWAHTFPFGNSPGFNRDPVIAEHLASRSFGGHIEASLQRVHNANLWVNFFANSHPLVGTSWDLPYADDPDMPPLAAFYRPSHTHAFYQLLMSEGVALGVALGYGEDYRAEVYMPIPTTIDEQMNVMARKYLNGSLGLAWLPSFVAAYTDYYGHMEFTGARELSDEQLSEVRQTLWQQATMAAGMQGAEPPLHYEFDNRRIGGEAGEFFRQSRNARRARADWLNAKKEQYGGDDDWFEKNYTTGAARMQVWREYWQAVGFEGAIPQPTPRIPLPTLDNENAERFGRDAAYAYASHVLRGIQRAYGRFTNFIEEELPAVFTIHNKSTMNHSRVSHAWTGTRTPNVDPAYLEGAANVIAVSEWNIDGVPKPYFLTTFYNRFLVDRGHPVQHQGLWNPMGSPARFMRDGVFWAGRQIQTFFDQPGNMSWSHRGADQTTYASNERMAQTTELLSWYSDLIPQLQPVREVGLYVPAAGDPWGAGVTRGHYVAMIASLMSDHQVHMVSHGDIADGRLAQYPVIYAASIHGRGWLFPFEMAGIRAWQEQGGELVVSQAPDYFHPEEVYTRFGISMVRVPVIDEDTGEPRTNRDGTVRTQREWSATPEQWARVTKEHVWADAVTERTHAAVINVHENFTHLDEEGNPATWSGNHWTGHHAWAGYRGAALHQYQQLKQVYDRLLEPIITKDQPEVFVNVNRPAEEGAQGLWVFASNWTIPDHPDMMEKRVVQGHFNSAVMPVRAQLGLRDQEIAAIYDLLTLQEVPLRRENGRVYFTADLDAVEGRIFLALPKAIAGVDVEFPQSLRAGDMLQPRMLWQDADGSAMPILGNAEITVRDAFGRVVTQQRRAVGVDGRLPSVVVPAGTPHLDVTIIDAIAGHIIEHRVSVEQAALAAVGPSGPVTVFRGDRVHQWFAELKAANQEIVVLVDSGSLEADDGRIVVSEANPEQAVLARWAERIAASLREAGLRVRVQTSEQAVTARLFAHPWTGEMASYRVRHSVPGYRIDAPVILVGSPRTSPIVAQMDRAMVLQRSAGPDAVFSDRSLISWAPRSFAPDQHSVVIGIDNDAALSALQSRLGEIARNPQPLDSHYQARELVRASWTPSEVVRHKQGRGVLNAQNQAQGISGEGVRISGERRWPGLSEMVGTAIFDMHASPAGVAVATKSWVKPVGAVSADGEILGFWGGGDEVTPRDVGMGFDGRFVAAGHALMGRSVIYDVASGERRVKHRSGIVHSSNPFSWDSFKESDRHISVSPDGRRFILVSTEAIIAYDASTGAEQWRIPLAVPDNRPQGQPQPEMAFAPDGSHVLVQVLRREEQPKTVDITVMRWNQREDGSWDTRNSSPTEFRLSCDLVRSELWLVNAETGQPKWTRLLNLSLVDRATSRNVWSLGNDVAYQEHINGRWRTFNAAEDHELPIVNGQEMKEPSRLRIPFWHLYSTVGPQGEWTMLGARSATFTLLDDEGNALRTWEDRHMPLEMRPGDMISPVVLPSRNPQQLLAFAPQRSTFFLYELQVGDTQTRRRARELQEQHEEALGIINNEIRNGRNYRNFGNQEYLEAFAQRIQIVPEDLRSALIDRMSRVPAERRAGRRRDHRFFSGNIDDIINRLHSLGSPIFDAAAGLDVAKEITVDAPINDAVADDDLTIVYAGLWDGTVRALRVSDGEELWRASVIGGSRMTAVRDNQGTVTALYAGGSRGDLYRLDPSNGEILWHHNITAHSNRFDP